MSLTKSSAGSAAAYEDFRSEMFAEDMNERWARLRDVRAELVMELQELMAAITEGVIPTIYDINDDGCIHWLDELAEKPSLNALRPWLAVEAQERLQRAWDL